MTLKLYQVDAFASAVFSGNPAAVCPLQAWLPDALLQAIAMENNLAETAFYVREDDRYVIRWFTPAVEVDLCGHATLAAAYVLFHHEGHTDTEIRFHSPCSGALKVTRSGEELTLDFPADVFAAVPLTQNLLDCFDRRPEAAFHGKTDHLLIFGAEADISSITPSMHHIAKLDGRGVIITAPGEEVDFVSRFFAPQSGIDEDPVTGSAHTTLAPYWADRLGRTALTAKQLSKRGGLLRCQVSGERVEISGEARLYLKGEVYLPD